MSVTGAMYNINATKKLGEMEIQEGLEGGNSWHNKYKHSAYVYIGGLHLGLTEGDVVIMFSQFGEIVDINMVRDKTTGKSKGFAFICYEDQRSTILAVDNMNGFQLLGRTVRVDHVESYKAPKKLSETETDAQGDAVLLEYEATGAEGKGHKVYNALNSQKKINEVALQRRKPVARKGPEDEDEAWAKQFEDSLKTMGAEPEEGEGVFGKLHKKKKKSKKELKKDKEDLSKVMEEMKKLKKEAKKAKEEAKRRKDEKKGKVPKQLVKSEKAAKSEADSSNSSSSSSSSSDSGEKPKKRKK